MEHFHYRNKCQLGHFFMNFHYARYENVKKSVPPKFKNEASDLLIRIKLHENLNFMSKSLYLEVKVSKRAKKCQKKPQIGLIVRFPNFFLPWLIWHLKSIAKIWWKKIWCHIMTLGVNFSNLVNLTGHFQSY